MRVQAGDGRWDDETAADLGARLAAGAVLAYPTETFYGLGCNPRDPAAVTRIVLLKGRPAGRPLPLIAATPGAARSLVRLDPTAKHLWERLTRRFWPGPLTVVALAAPGLAAGVLAGGDAVGVRVSSSGTARRVAGLCGGAIVATSANLSGQRPALSAADVEARLGAGVDLVIDGGTCAGGPPSTVVEIHRGRWRVLRPGAIDAAAVQEVLGDG